MLSKKIAFINNISPLVEGEEEEGLRLQNNKDLIKDIYAKSLIVVLCINFLYSTATEDTLLDLLLAAYMHKIIRARRVRVGQLDSCFDHQLKIIKGHTIIL